MTRHIHFYLDRKFTAEYSAQLKSGKRVSFSASVNASDQYEAGDKIKAIAEKKYGKDLFYPVIKFGESTRLSAGSQSQRVAAMAGPEEDAKRGRS